MLVSEFFCLDVGEVVIVFEIVQLDVHQVTVLPDDFVAAAQDADFGAAVLVAYVFDFLSDEFDLVNKHVFLVVVYNPDVLFFQELDVVLEVGDHLLAAVDFAFREEV